VHKTAADVTSTQLVPTVAKMSLVRATQDTLEMDSTALVSETYLVGRIASSGHTKSLTTEWLLLFCTPSVVKILRAKILS